MKYIFLIVIAITLNALEFSFKDFREAEKILVLKEFKKLYKERKNIHYNMRQVLKHARSKNLHKNRISFFQAKNSTYRESYLVELNNLYVEDEFICDFECNKEILESPQDATGIAGDATNIVEEDSDFANTMPEYTIPQDENSDIRGTVKSPWARR